MMLETKSEERSSLHIDFTIARCETTHESLH